VKWSYGGADKVLGGIEKVVGWRKEKKLIDHIGGRGIYRG